MPKTIYCPYFEYHSRVSLGLQCEVAAVAFRSREQRSEFVNRYCGSLTGWRSCTLSRSMTVDYEREMTYGKNGSERSERALAEGR